MNDQVAPGGGDQVRAWRRHGGGVLLDNDGWSCKGSAYRQALALIKGRVKAGQFPIDAKHTRRGLDQGLSERAVPAHLGRGDFGHEANTGQPDVDNLDRTVRKHMAVFRLVERLEGGKHLHHGRAVQGAAGKGYAQLVSLTNIAQITGPGKGYVARGNTIGLVLRDKLRLHGREVGVQAGIIDTAHWS